jgi:hypothetical protein
MSAPTLPALGAPLAAALAQASPAAAQQLQQLAAPGADAAAKAAELQAQADEAGVPAEAAVAATTQALGNEFSAITPVGQPAVPCACAECIGRAVDPAIAGAPLA